MPQKLIRIAFKEPVVKGQQRLVTVRITCRPVKIDERGIFIRGLLYAGCTGFRVTVSAGRANIEDYTGTESMPVEYTLEDGSEHSMSFNPVVKVEHAAGTKTEASVGSVQRVKRAGRTTSFAREEATLTATIDHDGFGVEWTRYLHRGKKAVKDFLEGNEEFSVVADMGRQRRIFFGTAQPVDRQFFAGADRRPLAVHAAIGLLIRAAALREPLPDLAKDCAQLLVEI